MTKLGSATLRPLKIAETIPQMKENGRLANHLLRAYATQGEALRRCRAKGQQKVIVEHASYRGGGQ